MPAETIAVLSRHEEQRASHLIDTFQATIGTPARCVVRAPGRVNLLGEHTDYNGLPVLPMAIDRSVLIALAPRLDRTIRVFNTARRFGPRTYTLSDAIAPYADGDWGNYSKAAAQELARRCGAQLQRGAEFLVDGDIPSGAGLSSSSALVVANALALLAANDVELPFETLAALLPVAERYVGTLSGGMDQATSLLARAGHALRIDFFPLRVRTVPVPAGYSFVVCHSLIQAEKSGAAKQGYNLRVIECRLVCRVLDRLLSAGLPRSLTTLGDLAVLFPHRPLLDFLPSLTAQLPERPLSLTEVAALIGTSPQRLREECGAVGDAFALLRRARHVLSEAERVAQAETALRAGDALAFGQLMDASHASCRDDYEVSCPELEELIALARDAGAVGARLTGAGFGGCTVNLLPEADVPGFLTRIDRHFYRSRLAHSERVGDYRFIFKPQAGAGVFRL
ncbi:MAG TPA: galactokinase [Candidatus Margulisiibacteriota bacterium]|nr:galactokinase [Candidatus Margulisiibacteriota bacterium]